MVGRPTGSKNKPKEENMQKYVTGKEEPMIKFMKEMEENICKRMEKMNENMMSQVEQMRKEWKEGKLEIEQERRKDKEECNTERRKLERRIEKLEWEREKSDRGRRRNNIVIRGENKWDGNKMEQQVVEFVKENLKVEVKVRKAFKIQDREKKCTIIAEIESWEEKREVMIRKKELRTGIFIDNDLTRKEREMQKQLKDIAKEEKEKGNNVKINYGKIYVKDKWLRWNEREGRLEDRGRRE